MTNPSKQNALGQSVADLTAKVNAILAVLDAHGLMADS